MNRIAKFIPPVLIELYIKWSKPKLTRKQFDSFEEALSKSIFGNYQNEELVDVIIQKNLNFMSSIDKSIQLELGSLRTLLATGSIGSSEHLKILDFGGGGGYHFFLANKVLGSRQRFTWNVVETPKMVEKARKKVFVEHLFFDKSISGAKKRLGVIDLVFTSSALQYCPDPLDYLRKLCDLDAKFVFITRTPFVNGDDDIITIQASRISDNGPGKLPAGFKDRNITYPITYISRQTAEAVIRSKYEIIYELEEGKGAFSFGKKDISMTGYFCVKK